MHAALEDEIRGLRDRFWSERDPEGRAFAPLADAYRRAGKLEEARDLTQEGTARLPDYVPGHLVSARVFRDAGEGGAASRAYRRVLDLDPANVEGLREAAALAETDDRTGDALDLWHRLVVLDPGNSTVRSRLRELKRRHFGIGPDADAEEAGQKEPASVGAVGPGQKEKVEAGTRTEVDAETVPEADGADDEPEVYTRTMAELCVRQGLLTRAVGIYRRLAEERPDAEELQARLHELEAARDGDAAPVSGRRAAASVPEGEEGAYPRSGGSSVASYFRVMLDWGAQGDPLGGDETDVVPVASLAPDVVPIGSLAPDVVPIESLAPGVVSIESLAPDDGGAPMDGRGEGP